MSRTRRRGWHEHGSMPHFLQLFKKRSSFQVECKTIRLWEHRMIRWIDAYIIIDCKEVQSSCLLHTRSGDAGSIRRLERRSIIENFHFWMGDVDLITHSFRKSIYSNKSFRRTRLVKLIRFWASFGKVIQVLPRAPRRLVGP